MSIDDEINELAWETLGEVVRYTPFEARQKLAALESDSECWLEKFKGTPLLPEAVALTQKELATEEAAIRRRMERENERVSNSDYNIREMIRVQKKKLDLKLAISTLGTRGMGKEAAVSPPLKVLLGTLAGAGLLVGGGVLLDKTTLKGANQRQRRADARARAKAR